MIYDLFNLLNFLKPIFDEGIYDVELQYNISSMLGHEHQRT